MPCRISGSWSTSTVSYLVPRRSRIATARLEKPHCGNSAVPFMKRTTSLRFTISPMRELGSPLGSVTVRLRFGHRRFELQCVKLSPYSPPERRIDRLVLLDAAHPGEAAADDARGIMVAVAGEVADSDFRIRDRRLDQPLDLAGGHRHQRLVLSMI